MLRSLFAGVTGLANHQLKLDVIGNNIANINTLGFKSSRVTFRDMLTQTIRGASRPSEGIGGTNPQQIGLGASVGSIDTNFTQGNMQITGIMTDMAIEGEGFFVLSDGFTQYYTRGGAFSLDAIGQMINPGNGYKLQGVLADEFGVIDQGQALQDIVVPTSLIVPARATSQLELNGNLDPRTEARGTIARTESFFAAAGSLDDLLSLYTEDGVSLGLNNDDNIMISATIGTTDFTRTYDVTSTSTFQDLVSFIESEMQSVDAGINLSVTATGQIEFNAGSQDIDAFSMRVSGDRAFNTAFFNGTSVTAGGTVFTNDELRKHAEQGDLLSELYSNGQRLDIDGDLSIDGVLGTERQETTNLVYDPATTTIGDLMNAFEQHFSIEFGNVEIENGRIYAYGDVGTDFQLNSINVSTDEGPIAAMNFTNIESARDGSDNTVTSIIYDSLGGKHSIEISFTKMQDENAWNWNATMIGQGQIVDGGSGIARFDSSGRLASFTTNSTTGNIVVDFRNNTDLATITVDPGEIGPGSTLSQFVAAASVRMTDMDGMGLGTLQTISIDRNGVINGQFSNGTNRDLAQVAMSDFNNPSGLNRVGENMFIFSPNSGSSNTVFAGTNARGTISPGELEMSNVDLAGEFTEMIIAQRGFQANARIISVGDQMLTELVNLKK